MDYNEAKERIRPGIYKHWKGGLYKVESIAVHTETDEIFVIYRSCGYEYGDPSYYYEDKQLWARPADMFLENGRFVPYDVKDSWDDDL